MQRSLGLEAAIMLNHDLVSLNQGSICEQFVGQELLAYQDYYTEKKIFFWARDAKSSNAEIDYIFPFGPKIYPIEVKSSKRGTMKSMQLFLASHPQSPVGLRYSLHELSFYDQIFSIPFYLISQTSRLLKEI